MNRYLLAVCGHVSDTRGGEQSASACLRQLAEMPTGPSYRQILHWGRCGSDDWSLRLLSRGIEQFSVRLFSVESRPVPCRSEGRLVLLPCMASQSLLCPGCWPWSLLCVAWCLAAGLSSVGLEHDWTGIFPWTFLLLRPSSHPD